MRRHATAVSTRWILRYLRVNDSWGASVARMPPARSPAPCRPRARTRTPDLTSSGFALIAHHVGAGSLWVYIKRNVALVLVATVVVVVSGSAKLNQEIIASRSAGRDLRHRRGSRREF